MEISDKDVYKIIMNAEVVMIPTAFAKTSELLNSHINNSDGQILYLYNDKRCMSTIINYWKK